MSNNELFDKPLCMSLGGRPFIAGPVLHPDILDALYLLLAAKPDGAAELWSVGGVGVICEARNRYGVSLLLGEIRSKT